MPPTDSDAERAAAWAAARQDLDGLPGGGLNIAHEALDRHVRAGAGARIALHCVAADAPPETLTYGELTTRAARFAAVLDRLGVGRGEVVCSLLGRSPALFTVALGTVRAGAVFCPLFQVFGPDPIRTRVNRAEASVVVTTRALYERKLAALLADTPSVRFVLIAEDTTDAVADAGAVRVLALDCALGQASPDRPVTATRPEDPALLFFTSGTTGAPKGALHVHEAAVGQHATARAVLGLAAGERYWCTADPGWVTGTVYGIFAPLLAGATIIADREEFDAQRWATLLAAERIAVWYTAPTALRLLMRAEAGGGLTWPDALADLRVAASVGEPLGAAGVAWGRDRLGVAIRETWWQTETGAIMIHHPGDAAVPDGAMGRPIGGIQATVLAVGEDNRPVGGAAVGETGMLALKLPWPSLFRTYIGDEARYRACFHDGWYLTGDLARCDEAGVFWFIGRADDAIKSAGHLIGPFEVESCLLDHPAVGEVCVVGRPDPLIGLAVEAHIVVQAGYHADGELRRALLALARRRLGPAVAPRRIVFASALPKTGSGKILRRAVASSIRERADGPAGLPPR